MSLSLPSVGDRPVDARVGERRVAIGRVALDWENLLVAVATVVAALLRLPTLAAKGFWYDELISVNIAREPVGAILRARLGFNAAPDLVDRLYTNNPPLHLLLIHATLRISPDEAFVRLPFTLAGIATVPVAYHVLLRLFDRGPALLSTALLAVSPLHIAYSQEARPSVFLVLFSLLSLLYLLRALDGDDNRNWVLFALVTAINCWTSYFALTFFLPTLACVAAVQLARSPRHPFPKDGPRTLWKPALAFAAVVVAVVPLFPDLLMTGDRNQVQAGDSAIRLVLAIPLALAAVAGMMDPLPGSSWTILPVLLPTLIGLWVLFRRPNRRGAIVAVWLVIPCTVLLLLASSHGVYFRYLLPILPVALAIPFVGISALRTKLQAKALPRVAQALTLSLLALVLAGYLAGIRAYEQGYIATGPIKRDWRGAVDRYLGAATPESCLILLDDLGLASYNEVPYYLNLRGSAARGDR
jgi:mannosyltransferase